MYMSIDGRFLSVKCRVHRAYLQGRKHIVAAPLQAAELVSTGIDSRMVVVTGNRRIISFHLLGLTQSGHQAVVTTMIRLGFDGRSTVTVT